LAVDTGDAAPASHLAGTVAVSFPARLKQTPVHPNAEASIRTERLQAALIQEALPPMILSSVRVFTGLPGFGVIEGAGRASGCLKASFARQARPREGRLKVLTGHSPGPSPESEMAQAWTQVRERWASLS
jgi:hypothetical protein